MLVIFLRCRLGRRIRRRDRCARSTRPGHGVVQVDDGHRHGARTVQGRRAGSDGLAGGTGAAHVQQDVDGVAARQNRKAARACGRQRAAPGAILPRWSHVRIELAGGQVLEQRVNTARGDARDPLSDAELIEKVADCFAYGNFDANAKAFAQHVFGLSQRRVSDALRAARAARVNIVV